MTILKPREAEILQLCKKLNNLQKNSVSAALNYELQDSHRTNEATSKEIKKIEEQLNAYIAEARSPEEKTKRQNFIAMRQAEIGIDNLGPL
jgi:hypothetical protein